MTQMDELIDWLMKEAPLIKGMQNLCMIFQKDKI